METSSLWNINIFGKGKTRTTRFEPVTVTNSRNESHGGNAISANFATTKWWLHGVFCGILLRLGVVELKKKGGGGVTTRGKTNPPKPGSIRIRRGSVRIFEDPWIRGSKKKKKNSPWRIFFFFRMHAWRPTASTVACVDLVRSTAANLCNMLFTLF